MKSHRYIPKIVSVAILLTVIFGVSAHAANAAGLIGSLFDYAAGAVALPIVSSVIGFIAYILLTIAAWGLSLAGTLLNVSMYLTTNLGMFIDQTPAIYTVWGIIRDLSSIILIFFILFAAIEMIIGQKSANYGNMIKQIIIIGVMINFSFFITRVMIDASNIVSLQFYNAIAPTNTASLISADDIKAGLPKIVGKLMTSGGISDTLMGQLNVTTWWKKNASNFNPANPTATAAQSSTDLLNMTLVTIGGITVAVITQLSFIAIAAAAIFRVAMLIFLLAFSPVWVASWALPQLKELTKKWSGQFYAQLVFLPVYLAFLYVALRIVTELQLNKVTDAAGQTVGLGNAINLFVGFGIVIVMLTIPMIAAVAVTSAVGGDSGIIAKWSQGTRGWVGRNTYGWLGRNTVGRAAYALDERLAKTRLGNIQIGRDARSVTTGLLAKTKIGSRSYEEARKGHKDIVSKAKANTRLRDLQALISSGSTDHALYSDIIGKMNSKEKIELKPDILLNGGVLKALDQSDFDAIKKTEDLDFTDDKKEQIKQARREALRNAVDTGQPDAIRHMMEESTGSELMKSAGKGPGAAKILTNPALVEHLTPAQLRQMEDEGIDDNVKTTIGKMINSWSTAHGKNHQAYGFVNKKDDRSWLGENTNAGTHSDGGGI